MAADIRCQWPDIRCQWLCLGKAGVEANPSTRYWGRRGEAVTRCLLGINDYDSRGNGVRVTRSLSRLSSAAASRGGQATLETDLGKSITQHRYEPATPNHIWGWAIGLMPDERRLITDGRV